MDNLYYTYAYLRENGTPYYIGKGKGNRCYTSRKRAIPCPSKDRILILKKNLTEEEAFKHEIYMIAVFGRKDLGTGILRNLTNGGEGSAGKKLSAETRKKMSAAKKGRPNPYKGKPRSEETRAKISKALKGRAIGEETRAKISAAAKGRSGPFKGKSHSEETRAKMSEARRRRKVR